MLTRLRARNFKQFDALDIELGNPVVFIGPNDSGKTTALQVLALWGLGLSHWTAKYGGRGAPGRRPAATINRRDLLAIPVPVANQLWRNLHTRDVTQDSGKQKTKNIRIDIIVNGVDDDTEWECGFEFDYANPESIYCRALRETEDAEPARMPVPDLARKTQIAYLPPMSGLAATESRLMEGAVNVRIGEGRTAEVLRNLCFQIYQSDNGDERWTSLVSQIKDLFGVTLNPPVLIEGRGEIEMSFRNRADVPLDLSASGRGLQQTLLLLAYLMTNSQSVLLLDEPDAHLEILRQRQIYELLSEAAREYGSQVVAASHSEVILNEAADRDVVVAFVGNRPHRIDDRGAQVLKSLKSIGFEDYYQAEITGWLIYLEGSTDLAILRAFAETMNHEARNDLKRPFVVYVDNQPSHARQHFFGLREAKQDLTCYALFDRLESQPSDTHPNLVLHCWEKREIENYFTDRDVLLTWAREIGDERQGPLFGAAWEEAMEGAIDEIEVAMTTLGESPWSDDIKVTDRFLDPLFTNFFARLGLPILLRKTNYHELARYVSPEKLDGEVRTVLDEIHSVALRAQPRE
ncbi:MAG TPA: AAA family ATPase [Solirubrobacteraceae bacterium]|jgi:ABC-type hemin transport system ATPase subunit|nr:AAA family ATPase [Solirubrobacteraceae bacterium]